MKKVLVLIFIILICFKGFSQTLSPVTTPGVTNRSSLPVEDKFLFARQHFGLPRFSDTSQALIYGGIDTCGALIYTYNYGLWYRYCGSTGKKWVQIQPSGNVASDTSYWKTNVLNDFSLSPNTTQVLGTLSNHNISFATNGLKRFALSKDGILPAAGTVKPLGIDSVSGYLSFSSGGSGGSGWSLTGNSGTNPSTNFLGTTDNKTLEFRVNNTRAGILSYSNVGFGDSALLGFTANVGLDNVAIGRGALQKLTTGTDNVAVGDLVVNDLTTGGFNVIVGDQNSQGTNGNYNVGVGALAGNTFGDPGTHLPATGSYNTYVGGLSFSNNTTGSYNSAFGLYTLVNNTTGSHNSVFGNRSGGTNTTGQYNTYLGDSTGFSISTGSNNTILGSRVTGLSSSLSNNLILAIGDGTIKQRFYASDSVTISNIVSSPTSTRDLMLVQDSISKKVGYRAIPTSTTPGIDNVLAVGQSLTTNRSIDIGANVLTIGRLGTTGGIKLESNENYTIGDYGDFDNGLKFRVSAAGNNAWLDNIAHTAQLGINTIPTVTLDVVGSSSANLKYSDAGLQIIDDDNNQAPQLTFKDLADGSIGGISFANAYMTFNANSGYYFSNSQPTTIVSLSGTGTRTVVADGSGVLSTTASPYAITTVAADATNADFTIAVNSIKYLPAATLSANRTITFPTGSNGDIIEIYNNEAGFTWNLAGAAVYLSDGVTTVTSLLANTNYIIRKVSGKWRISN